jgi:DNA (cytosine-5)-methyltransferase 1
VNVVAGTLGTKSGGGRTTDLDSHGAYVTALTRKSGRSAGPDDSDAQGGHLVEVSPTVTAKWKKGSGGPAGDETQNLVDAPSFNVRTAQTGANGWGIREGESGTLDNTGAGAVYDGEQRTGLRRLTPTECERLQGFPDGWTHLLDQVETGESNPKPDSHRYAMMGNAVTVNVAEWLGRRIMEASE